MRVLYESPSKEEKESSIFESFILAEKDLPNGQWQKSEAPDYLLKTEAGCIGLEITSLVLNHARGKHSEAAIRKSQDNCYRIAAKLAEEEGIPPTEVKARFINDTIEVGENAAAKELFGFVKEKLKTLPDSGGKHFHPHDLKYFKNWARLIQKIYEVDPLTCPKCSGKMKVISVIEDQDVIKTPNRSLCQPSPISIIPTRV
jgi:hypothetical protein